MDGGAAESATVATEGEIPPNDLLREYLDIDFIARGTAFVGPLIYYPFILISLLIISRSGVFDHWTWPVALVIIVAFNAGYAAFSVIYLRRTAERARQLSLKRLHDMLISYTAIGQCEGKRSKNNQRSNDVNTKRGSRRFRRHFAATSGRGSFTPVR